jgi:Tol biopolymer transport system component
LKKILFFAFLLLFHTSPVLAKFDPAFSWTTMKSPHFAIHYHQGEEEIAKRVAVIAEDVHDRLAPRIKWTPSGRTNLVLVDATDDPNGVASPFPYNYMVLYITQPAGGPGFGTTAYDEWMRLLITHEYAHILQLDMTNGFFDILQYIFGRFYFPNMYQPAWMIEGLATYEETEQTAGGRGRSPGSEMVLRMAVLEDRFPKMSQASTFPDSWPAGQVPYLFGESFTRYIVQKHGREKLADISQSYSKIGIPWVVDLNGKRVLGRWYSDLWDEWQKDLATRYTKLRTDLAAKGLTASLPLTKRGYMNIAPALSPDGTHIAYTVMNADEFPGIYLMNTDGSGDHKILDNVFSTTSSGASIAWSPLGNGIYYTRLDIYKNTNLYNDIFFYDVKKGKEIRITRHIRARDPHPSPDSKKLVFVTNKLGKTRLAVADLSVHAGSVIGEKDISYLTEESTYQYETPRFSPDGTMIAVAVWQPGGYKDVWILDAQGKKIEEVTHDRAIDMSPAWSADGKILYFASDRTGIFNLHAYEPSSKKIYQVTNVLGGAFSPTPSPDAKFIVFSSYSSRGYDIHMRLADSTSWGLAEPFKDPYPQVTYADKPVQTTTSSYNPLPTLLPRFWIPWFGYGYESGFLSGFLTTGSDAVQRHDYSFMGLYGPRTDRLMYSFYYSYGGLYPRFTFQAWDVDDVFGDLLSDARGKRDYTERSQVIEASLVFPLLKFESQHALLVGYRRKNTGAITALPPWPGYNGPVPAQGTHASARAQYLFNNAKQYDFSISPEGGRTIQLGYERLDKALGSDFEVQKYTGDWHEYISFPWKHHVLQVRAFYGFSTGDVIPQRAFQLGGDNPGDFTIPVTQESVYLRGYPVNEFRGRNAALASLEYRLPIVNIERGISNTPVFLRRFHGAVFAETGNAWDRSFHIRELKSSVGAEARLDMYLSYYFPITLRIGIAQGLDGDRDTRLIFNIWSPVLY